MVDRTVALDAVVWGPSGKEGGAPLAPKPHTASSALAKTRVKGKYTKSANYKMPKKATLSAKYVAPLLLFLSTCHGLSCHSVVTHANAHSFILAYPAVLRMPNGSTDAFPIHHTNPVPGDAMVIITTINRGFSLLPFSMSLLLTPRCLFD